MTFSKEVKSEICHIFDLTDDQKKSLLSSFLSNNAQIKIINKKES
jgi:DNA-binding transcriptional regulator WhiA